MYVFFFPNTTSIQPFLLDACAHATLPSFGLSTVRDPDCTSSYGCRTDDIQDDVGPNGQPVKFAARSWDVPKEIRFFFDMTKWTRE